MAPFRKPLSSPFAVLSLSFGLCLFSLAGFAGEEAPPLPEGLGESQKTDGGPGAQSPALPEGLGGSESSGPALPEGLGGESAAPPDPTGEGPQLPEGLGEEPADAKTADDEQRQPTRLRPEWLHGFWDLRAGIRTQDDPAQSKDGSLGELRLQLETEKIWDEAVLKYRGDFLGDGVLEKGGFDLRELSLTLSPTDFLDVRAGRQVLTWGTGDLLFLNDLSPKTGNPFSSAVTWNT